MVSGLTIGKPRNEVQITKEKVPLFTGNKHIELSIDYNVYLKSKPLEVATNRQRSAISFGR